MNNTPLPAGIKPPTFWERVIPEWVWDFIAFGNEHILWFIAFLIIVLLIKFAIDHKRKQQKQIHKLWLYTLFFLSKRQMMLPLIVTLSQRDGLLDDETLEEILDIRQKCRDVSFKKHPKKRLELEKIVSQVLYHYFSNLEKQGKIREKSKFEHVIHDLEFIDEKLVALQKTYNQAAYAWNKHLRMFPGFFFKLWGFKDFEPFA